ncbi:MAG: TatD family nuclease-associated radical SAM protein [Pelosinus sp.]|nr:TatD family nuclease-associated radical SAM protein [Pelosinus sp.]
MTMMITYEVGQALYLNITNRCSNDCTFCVRNNPDGMQGLDLWLEREPTVEEVLADIARREVSSYKELVFCGFGEPLSRFSEILEISRQVKKLYSLPIRINTNGQGSLIAGRDITPDFEGLIDAVSISLNAKNQAEYQAVCLSQYGEAAFAGLLDFAAKARKYIPKVILSVVDIMPAEDIEACREIAKKIGVQFRVRKFVE